MDPTGNEYYSRSWNRYTWHPDTIGKQAWKLANVIPGGKFVNWVVDQETLGDSTISYTEATTSVGIDSAVLLAGAFAKAPKTSYKAYKLSYMIKAGIKANKYLGRGELLYEAIMSPSQVVHEQALYQYIKLAGLEKHLTSSTRSLSETGEEVKKRINSRVNFIDEYITKSNGDVDLIDLRKKFEGYYNEEGNFVKGYLQNEEKMEIPIEESFDKVYHNGTYYYDYEKNFSNQYINESQISGIFRQGWYNPDPDEGYHNSYVTYFDKNGKPINNEEDLTLDFEFNIEDYIK